ncbi:MAG: hypothetical protein Q8P32_02330 [Candidatus Komeilibacteria bacterium]|nr:hypothetical protein [Candidatus Komeilibacteria bacterium]
MDENKDSGGSTALIWLAAALGAIFVIVLFIFFVKNDGIKNTDGDDKIQINVNLPELDNSENSDDSNPSN